MTLLSYQVLSWSSFSPIFLIRWVIEMALIDITKARHSLIMVPRTTPHTRLPSEELFKIKDTMGKGRPLSLDRYYHYTPFWKALTFFPPSLPFSLFLHLCLFLYLCFPKDSKRQGERKEKQTNEWALSIVVSALLSLATLQRLADLTVNSVLWIGGGGGRRLRWGGGGRWGVVALRERDTLIIQNVRRVNVENWRLGI